MTWPLSQDYNEAIQDANNSFSDAELKTGEAVANALGIPMPRSGNFADVYEVRCPSGTRWAVKCFTRQVSGLSERYSEISKYLRLANLPFMVDFKYLEQGIRVRGQWYPILKMQWVEGFVLNEFVRDNLDKKPILNALGQIWLRMARRLRESYIAHCDLQHGNVLFVPGSTANSLAVKLIDYDGMCVPALAGTKSGEVGHPAFQHPERLRTGAYHQEVDRFALLSIATSLRCLTVGGRALWERYDNGDNLLFRSADLQAPAESPLFQELLKMPDAQAQALVKELYRACQGPLDDVPLLTDLLPEEKPASKGTTAVAKQPTAAAAQGPDWDFQEDEPSASVVKKIRPASKSSAGKIPVWVWGAGAAALVLLLLGAGVGVGLALRKGPAEKEAIPVALNKPETITSAPVKQPVNNGPRKPPKEPQLVPVKDNNNPPLTVSPARPSASRIFQLMPAGEAIAVAEKGGWNWKLLEPGTNKLIREFRGHTGAILAIAFSPDGKLAVTAAEDERLRVWDMQTGETINWCPTTSKKVVRIALTPDGKRVACADRSRNVLVWDFENKKGGPNNFPREVACVAFSDDGRYMAVGLDESNKESDVVVMLSALAPRLISPSCVGQPTRVHCLAISPDGKYVATGHASGRADIVLWDAANGKQVKRISVSPTPEIHQVRFSPDSRLVLAASGNFVGAWRIEDSKLVSGFAPPAPDMVLGGFSADNKRLHCVSVHGAKVQLQSGDIRGGVAVVVKPPSPAPKPPQPRPGKFSDKPPVPDKETLAEPLQEVQEEFKDAYKREGGKRDLAKQLTEKAFKALHRSAKQYVYFHESALIAGRVGDLPAAMQTIDQMAFRWDINVLELKAVVVEQAAAGATRPAQNRTVARKALLLVERGLMTEQFELAERLLTIARTAASKADVKDVLKKSVDQEARKLEQFRTAYTAIKSAVRTLEDNPDDPEANQALGTFRCVVLGNWAAGLPLLAKSGDKALAAVADKDLADPDEAAVQAKVGDGWYDLKESDKKVKAVWQMRASQWYEDAYAQLPKADRGRVKTRLQTLSQQLGLSKAWQHMDIGDAKIIRGSAGSVLRLRPHHVIATRECYGQSLEVTVVALLTQQAPKNHVRLTLFNGGELAVTLENNRVKYDYNFVAGSDPDGAGIGPNKSTTIVKPGEPVRLRYRVKADGVEFWINDMHLAGPFKTN